MSRLESFDLMSEIIIIHTFDKSGLATAGGRGCESKDGHS